jgi:hypothetical protein
MKSLGSLHGPVIFILGGVGHVLGWNQASPSLVPTRYALYVHVSGRALIVSCVWAPHVIKTTESKHYTVS